MFDLSVRIWASLLRFCALALLEGSRIPQWLALKQPSELLLVSFSCFSTRFLMYGLEADLIWPVWSLLFDIFSCLSSSLSSICLRPVVIFFSFLDACCHADLAFLPRFSCVVLSLSRLRSPLSPSPFFSLCWWSYFESQATSLLLMISSSWTSVKLASSSRSQLHYKPLTKSSHASDKI